MHNKLPGLAIVVSFKLHLPWIVGRQLGLLEHLHIGINGSLFAFQGYAALEARHMVHCQIGSHFDLHTRLTALKTRAPSMRESYQGIQYSVKFRAARRAGLRLLKAPKPPRRPQGQKS